jgi:anti-anti-sigma factor
MGKVRPVTDPRYWTGGLELSTDPIKPEDAAPAEFAVEVSRQNATIMLALEGELDLATVSRLEREIESAEKADHAVLLLDLRRLRFIDSSGLRLILLTAERARESGRRLIVVRGPVEVDRVFQVSGTAEQVEIVDDPGEAETAA